MSGAKRWGPVKGSYGVGEPGNLAGQSEDVKSGWTWPVVKEGGSDETSENQTLPMQ